MVTTFRVRLTLTVLLVAAAAMLLTGLLNVYKFESALAQISESRVTYILRNLHSVLSTRLTLGLPVSDVPGLRDALSDIAEQDPQIMAIEIFDPSGQVLISTDTSFEGDLVSEAWLRAAAIFATYHGDETGSVWTVRDGPLSTVGMPLRNGLGQIVGAIALTFQRAEQAGLLQTYRWTLLRETAVLTAMTCLLAGLVVFGGLRPLVATLNNMRERLAALNQPSKTDQTASTTDQTAGYNTVESHVGATLGHLEQTARSIRRLDWEE